MTDREHRLRERAYQIWQDEGEPHGRYQDHWLQAEKELELGEIGLDEQSTRQEVVQRKAKKPATKRSKP